jgi:hypothetical protein
MFCIDVCADCRPSENPEHSVHPALSDLPDHEFLSNATGIKRQVAMLEFFSQHFKAP